MTHIVIGVLAFTPAIVCTSAAFWLAAHDKGGWGWFLFAAILIGGSYSFKDKTK